jgi:hypothetical protein
MLLREFFCATVFSFPLVLVLVLLFPFRSKHPVLCPSMDSSNVERAQDRRRIQQGVASSFLYSVRQSIKTKCQDPRQIQVGLQVKIMRDSQPWFPSLASQ